MPGIAHTMNEEAQMACIFHLVEHEDEMRETMGDQLYNKLLGMFSSG